MDPEIDEFESIATVFPIPTEVNDEIESEKPASENSDIQEPPNGNSFLHNFILHIQNAFIVEDAQLDSLSYSLIRFVVLTFAWTTLLAAFDLLLSLSFIPDYFDSLLNWLGLSIEEPIFNANMYKEFLLKSVGSNKNEGNCDVAFFKGNKQIVCSTTQ